MALEAELKTYEERLESLLPEEGKFVLIHGTSVLGTFDTYEDAIKGGYDKCQLAPFLVKRIQAVDRVQCFTRALNPYHTLPCPS